MSRGGNGFAARIGLYDGVPSQAGVDVVELRKSGHWQHEAVLRFCHALTTERVKHAARFGQVEHAAVNGHDA